MRRISADIGTERRAAAMRHTAGQGSDQPSRHGAINGTVGTRNAAEEESGGMRSDDASGAKLLASDQRRRWSTRTV